jgi:hypothetical protein
LLIIDEASRVEDSLYQSVRPMLAVSKGRIILLSTPFGKRGFFHTEWTNGEGWQRTKITADLCPRIDKDWLERERKMIGDWWFRQEYLCEFIETTDSVFNFNDIAKAISKEVEPMRGLVKQKAKKTDSVSFVSSLCAGGVNKRLTQLSHPL